MRGPIICSWPACPMVGVAALLDAMPCATRLWHRSRAPRRGVWAGSGGFGTPGLKLIQGSEINGVEGGPGACSALRAPAVAWLPPNDGRSPARCAEGAGCACSLWGGKGFLWCDARGGRWSRGEDVCRGVPFWMFQAAVGACSQMRRAAGWPAPAKRAQVCWLTCGHAHTPAPVFARLFCAGFVHH